MRKTAVGVGVFALLTAHCSSPSTSTSSFGMAPSEARAAADASVCVVPAGVDTLDAGYGCKQEPQGPNGCSTSEYELACRGTDAGAAVPAASLGCHLDAVPGNIDNFMAFCCPCGH